MDSRVDAEAWAIARVRVLTELRARLERAESLAASVRQALGRADVDAIDSATARMETLAQEVKLLAEEHRRLGAAPPAIENDPRLVEARRALRETTTRLARGAAVAGGLLVRMVGLSRGLLSMLDSARSGTYRPSGTTPEIGVEGLRLQERV